MMGDRMNHGGSYFHYSPSAFNGRASPHRPLPSSPSLDRDSNGRYLAELMAERQKLGPFMKILPLCTRLLNQEIIRASGLVPNPNFVDQDRIEHESPLRSIAPHSNGRLMDLEGWSVMQTEENGFLQGIGAFQTPSMGWHGSPGLQNSPVVKKVIRLDVPADKFPNFNWALQLDAEEEYHSLESDSDEEYCFSGPEASSEEDVHLDNSDEEFNDLHSDQV